MPFELTDNVHVERDAQGNVQHLDHFQQPFVAVGPGGAESDVLADADVPTALAVTPQGLAQEYLKEVAPVYGISDDMLPSGPVEDALGGAESDAVPTGSKLELTEEKDLMGTTTVSYQQTYNNLPIWEAGVSVTIQPEPMRVTASQSSIHSDVSLPEGEALDAAAYGPDAITEASLKKLLGVKGKVDPTINSRRLLIYRYDPEKRIDPEALNTENDALQEAPPTLPLPDVPASIQAGEHYVVTEVLFTLPVDGFGPVNWRAFVEENTGAVLYLRAFIACASGMIYRTDPVTAGAPGTVVATSPAATLDPFRSTVPLDGLTSNNPQPLSGQFVELRDTNPPAVAPPTQVNPPANFHYSAPTREFAAVNAYHHSDWLFRYMQGMGFNIATYFDGTTFPVPVDAVAFGDAINARAPGNAMGNGSLGFQYGLAGSPFPAVSIAADVRVVLHEFGHALLWDSVHSPNFGFAHSAGDSLAAVLMDPESALRTDPVRRFETFPWILPDRNHGRSVAAGWGWGGANDVGGYSSEQILSTTHFRLYRSLGGDSADVNRRRLAARQTAYLIFRAIGSLATNPVTPTPLPDIYATALMNADIGTLNFEGHRGGAFHKVIRWSFEKQGLYQAPGAPRPVITPGAPPNVDVYINDGRNGEYQYQPVHWDCTDIWNRLAVTPGGGTHETPVVGQTNFAYVRVKNRGTQHANNVVVRGYSADPGAGLSWPGDWTPMDTPQIAVAGGIPAGGTVIVGPFRWTPRFVGHECMFMEVSATGDLSNIDPATFFPCATGPTPEWRLVPFDNNLGQRNVAPVPGAGSIRGLLTAFLRRRFIVRNPFEKQVRIEVKAELPPFLAERGWKISLNRKENGTSFGLGPGADREVFITLRPGKEFTAREVQRVKGGVAIRVYAYADGMVIGGMTYQLDPRMKQAPIEKVGDRPISPNHPEIERIIRESQLSDDEAQMDLFIADTGSSGGAEADYFQGDDQGATSMSGASGSSSTISVTGATDEATAALGDFLGQVTNLAEAIGKVSRVKIKKVTLEIEMAEE
jgi:hypothetical protein